ncbi:MAG: hypothetical protein JKY37_16460 [Nannocystaceae bacterium]|nr:hypothetical protein [Nannocystaceae bacterium]
MLASPIPSTQLRHLVQQLLLGHVDELDARCTAAFVQGWSSALALMRRSEITAAGASVEVQAAVTTAVDRVEAARRQVLDDDSETPLAASDCGDGN